MRIVKDYPLFQRKPQTPAMHLSFQSPALTLVKGVQWALSLIALASLGFAVSFWLESRTLDEQSDYYEHALARQHRVSQLLAEDMARTGLTLTNEQINAVRKEVDFTNQLTEKRDFSWTKMLHNLEGGMPPHVSINSVRLNFQDSTIRLQGVVKTIQDLDKLTTKLNETGTFSRVDLAEHSIQTSVGTAHRSTEPVSTVQSNQGASDFINFSLTATYHQTY